jgi:hypothetical protein
MDFTKTRRRGFNLTLEEANNGVKIDREILKSRLKEIEKELFILRLKEIIILKKLKQFK